jgi:hypothetical protein
MATTKKPMLKRRMSWRRSFNVRLRLTSHGIGRAMSKMSVKMLREIKMMSCSGAEGHVPACHQLRATSM